MNFGLKPNFKVAGPALGAKNQKPLAEHLLRQIRFSLLISWKTNGEACIVIDGEEMTITKDFVDIQISAKEGFTVSMENNVFTIFGLPPLQKSLFQKAWQEKWFQKIQQLRKQRDF